MNRFGPFFVAPVVVGLDDGHPILYEYDSIGTQTNTENFAVGGTAGANMVVLMENYYKPDMSPEQLEDCLAEILVSGTDRDILSGYGGVVYVMTTDELRIVDLKTKMV